MKFLQIRTVGMSSSWGILVAGQVLAIFPLVESKGLCATNSTLLATEGVA